jgi:hypothetical protein
LVEKKDMQDSFYCSAILGQDFVDGMRWIVILLLRVTDRKIWNRKIG